MIQVKDIPQDLLDKIKEMFNRDPKVGELRVHQQLLMRSGRYEEALDVARSIDFLFDKVVCEYLEEAERQAEQIDVADMDIPSAEKEKMMQLLLVCFMCADMIESAVIGMDDILQKYDKDLHIAMFNDIREVMKMAESKLKFIQTNSSYMKDLVWADNCDNMFEMIQNKAAAIMRKRKNDPNWGKNMEKFYKQK